MSREAIEELIARQAELNAEQFDIDKKLSELPPEHLWVTNHDDSLDLTPAQAKVKESFFTLNSRKLAVQSQIDRANLFSLHHMKSRFPTLCLTCFLIHIESPLVEIESKFGSGIRVFRCEKCGHELQVDETVPQPGVREGLR